MRGLRFDPYRANMLNKNLYSSKFKKQGTIMKSIVTILVLLCVWVGCYSQSAQKKPKIIEDSDIGTSLRFQIFIMPNVYFTYLIRLDTFDGEASYLMGGRNNDNGTWVVDSSEKLVWTPFKGGPQKPAQTSGSRTRYRIWTAGGRAFLLDMNTGNSWFVYLGEDAPHWKPFSDNSKN